MSITNRIAIVDMQGQLTTCAPDGSDTRVLTRPDRLYQFPAWSPDGSRIAAVGSDRGGSGVYCFADDAQGEQLQLYRSFAGTGKSPFYLYWAPDSQRLTFLANNPVGGIGFHIVDREALAESRLLALGQPFFWQWGKDSAEIMIHTGGGDEGRLDFIDPTVGPKKSRNHATPGYFQSPGISPSGNYIAYAALDEDGKSSIVLENRNSRRKIVHAHRGAVVLGWSPTREHIAFMAPESNEMHYYGPLRLLGLDGKVKMLSSEAVLAYFWSPDGQKIAYFSPTRTASSSHVSGNTGSASINGGSQYGMGNSRLEKSLTSEKVSERESDIVRLELWIVDLQSRTRMMLHNFRPTRLFLNQFLPFFDQYTHSHRIWSPASDALVLPLVQEEKSQITVIPVNGDEPTAIAEGYTGFWSQN